MTRLVFARATDDSVTEIQTRNARVQALLASEFLTAMEAAEIVRCSASHIRRACAAGELPAVPLGRAWRIRPSDLRAWMTTATKNQQR